MWDSLDADEVLVEQVPASFFMEGRGDLAVTDRRLLFRMKAQWGDGPSVVTVPFVGVKRCWTESRRRVDGRSDEVFIRLVGSDFVLRFGVREGGEDTAGDVVEAVRRGTADGARGEWPTPPLIVVDERARSALEQANGQLYVHLKAAWGDASFHTECTAAPVAGRRTFEVGIDPSTTLNLGYEVAIFDRLWLVKEWSAPASLAIRMSYEKPPRRLR